MRGGCWAEGEKRGGRDASPVWGGGGCRQLALRSAVRELAAPEVALTGGREARMNAGGRRAEGPGRGRVGRGRWRPSSGALLQGRRGNARRVVQGTRAKKEFRRKLVGEAAVLGGVAGGNLPVGGRDGGAGRGARADGGSTGPQGRVQRWVAVLGTEKGRSAGAWVYTAGVGVVEEGRGGGPQGGLSNTWQSIEGIQMVVLSFHKRGPAGSSSRTTFCGCACEQKDAKENSKLSSGASDFRSIPGGGKGLNTLRVLILLPVGFWGWILGSRLWGSRGGRPGAISGTWWM